MADKRDAERAASILEALDDAKLALIDVGLTLNTVQNMLEFELPENRQNIEAIQGALKILRYAVVQESNVWLSIKYAREG